MTGRRRPKKCDKLSYSNFTPSLYVKSGPLQSAKVVGSASGAPGVAGVAGVPGVGAVLQPEPPANLKPRPPSHYLWAALIARIYEVFPLICPHCGGQMRIMAFITFSADIHKILEHIEVEPEAPRITPARGPPLWDECGAQETREGVEALPDWDLANQSPPEYPDDQRLITSVARCGDISPPVRGCVCGQPLPFIVTMATQIPGKSDWRPWMCVLCAARFRCDTYPRAFELPVRFIASRPYY
ncbi:hypothetical protein M2244_003784 [Rhodoferax antarcticus]|nr:hypothetical protein [Rhodoferax antarcticus]